MRWTGLAVVIVVMGCEGIDLRQEPPLEARSRVRPEPPGVHCELGGRAFQAGVDADGDGLLDDAEVSSTEYVCETATPAVLVRTRQVAPGAQCPHGGQVSHAGQDVNGNGLLEDAEVSSEVLGCMEPAPVLSRLRPAPEGSDCQLSVGVEAGPDVNGDGTLDIAERQATGEVCGVDDPSLIRVQLQPEAPGGECPRGGSRVVAWADLDGDGAVRGNEPSTVLYACQPSGVYSGTYRVRDAADLAALQGVSHVRGGLIIRDSSLSEVVLPQLRAVEGPLDIGMNGTLTRVELGALGFVGDSVKVELNPQLESLKLGFQRIRLWVERDVSLVGNARLESLELGTVAPRRDLIVRDNAALQDLLGFTYVERLSGSLSIEGNGLLRSISLPNLQGLGGSLSLSNNDSLASLEAFSRLQTVEGMVGIYDNDGLTDLEGLGGLSAVGGLSVSSNPHLRFTRGLSGLRRAGFINISHSDVLESAGEMPSLQNVPGSFILDSNPALLGVVGLSELRFVGTLRVLGNDSLSDLRGLEGVPFVERLDVLDNAALTSLEHLSGLRELRGLNVQRNGSLSRFGLNTLARVKNECFIVDNPKLPTCLARAFADDAYLGGSERLFIVRNDDAASCAE